MVIRSHLGVKRVLNQQILCKFLDKIHFVEPSYNFMVGQTIVSPIIVCILVKLILFHWSWYFVWWSWYFIFIVHLEAKVPRDENNSWWDKVGRPESVGTTYKTHKLAKLQKQWKIIINYGQSVSKFFSFSLKLSQLFWFAMFY